MTQQLSLAVKKVFWRDCKNKFKKIIPDLYRRIEAIDPDDSLFFYRAFYPFGSPVIDEKGDLQLPLTDGSHVALTDAAIPHEMKSELHADECDFPVALLTKGQLNLFRQAVDGAVDLKAVCKPGAVLLPQCDGMNKASAYSINNLQVVAGSCVSFFVPSIANKTQFEKLRSHFNLKSAKPCHKTSQQPVLAEIAATPEFYQSWQAEIYFMSSSWLESMQQKQESLWELLRYTLCEQSSKYNFIRRYYDEAEKIWRYFINHIKTKVTHQYVFALAKEVIDASLGRAPVFQIANFNDVAGPYTKLADAIVNIYGIEEFAPIVMNLTAIDFKQDSQAYFPIKIIDQVLPEKMPDNITLLELCRQLQYVINSFVKAIKTNRIDVRGTHLSGIMQLDYDFFFIRSGNQQEFKPSESLFVGNELVQKIVARYGLSKFPTSTRANFISACVLITSSFAEGV